MCLHYSENGGECRTAKGKDLRHQETRASNKGRETIRGTIGEGIQGRNAARRGRTSGREDMVIGNGVIGSGMDRRYRTEGEKTRTSPLVGGSGRIRRRLRRDRWGSCGMNDGEAPKTCVVRAIRTESSSRDSEHRMNEASRRVAIRRNRHQVGDRQVLEAKDPTSRGNRE